MQKWTTLSAQYGGRPSVAVREHMGREGAWSHETVHLFQYCGTPLGLALCRLEAEAADCFLAAARALVQSERCLRKPLIAWTKARRRGDRPYELLSKGVRLDAVRRCLLGTLQFDLDRLHEVLPRAIDSLRRREELSVPVDELARVWDSTRANDRYGWPKSRAALAAPASPGNGGLFGAHSLWEGAARWVECAYLGGWRERRNWSRRYVAAPILFRKITGSNCLPTGVLPTPAGLTFLAVCDLASFTPLHPTFAPQSSDELKWRDFHPGWRFLAACRAVRQVAPLCKASPASSTVEEAVTNYRRFADDVADACGWPTMDTLAEAGLSSSTSATDDFQSAYLAAGQIRLSHPAALGLADFSPRTAADAEYVIDQAGTVSDFGARAGGPWAVLRAGAPAVRAEDQLGATYVVVTETIPKARATPLSHDLLRQLVFERGRFRPAPTPDVEKVFTRDRGENQPEEEDPRLVVADALRVQPTDILIE